jgi:hypothetical protein
MSDNGWADDAITLLILTEEISGFSGIFGYSPAPGAGNLILSVTAAGGTDPYGNTYIAGITTYGPNGTYSELLAGVLNMFTNGDFSPAILEAGAAVGFLSLTSPLINGTDTAAGIGLGSQGASGSNYPVVELDGDIALSNSNGQQPGLLAPVTGASGVTLYAIGANVANSFSNLKYLSADQNYYNTGRLSIQGPAANQAITSTTPVAITGLSFNVGAGRYRIRAKIGCTQGGAAAAANIRIAAVNATLSTLAMTVNWFLAASGDSNGLAWVTGTTFPIIIASPAFAATDTFWLELDGTFLFSAAGVITFQGAQGVSGDNFTVLANSFIDIEPVG